MDWNTSWVTRQRPLRMEETKDSQCYLDELRSISAVSRPDIRVHLAKMAARAGEIYCMNDFSKTVEARQPQAALKTRPDLTENDPSMADWSRAAYGGQ